MRHFSHPLKVGAALTVLVASTPFVAPATAAPSDFAFNFIAAAPFSYDHATGGGAFDDEHKGKSFDVVESLEGQDFRCNDIVTLLTQIVVSNTSASIAAGARTLRFHYSYLMDTTGQSGVAIGKVVRAMVNYPPVQDLIPGENNIDEGIIDDGGSVATLVDTATTGPIFTAGSELLDTVTVTDVEAGESIILRTDVQLLCQPGSTPTGNLQASLDSAYVIATNGGTPVTPPTTIPVGAQTIPFLHMGLLGTASVSLNKTTNGVDSATILAGAPVTWTYVVTNTGDLPLTNLTVVDDQGVVVTCPATSLAVGASITCTGSGTATAGLYSNLGTAIAWNGNESATATDPSSYFGAAPSISINKLTNGGDSLTISEGAAVNWTYLVTNTGNVPLTGVGVIDDQGVTVSCPSSTLAVAAFETCTASGTAIEGWYTNVGTASATGAGAAVSASDPSSYFGANPSLSLVKTTNGFDGINITAGTAVLWNYVVTNTGNVPLTGLTVIDDQGETVSCATSVLAIGASETCTASGTAIVGAYSNLGTATATDGRETVTASDPSSYFGAAPAISISKLTNGGDSVTVSAGGPVSWTYEVTNTGNVPLTNVGVIDDQGVVVTCPASTLAVDASQTCTGSGTAVAGWYQNIGTAAGTDGLETVTASDPSSYFGSAPAISISKLTNGGDSVTVKAGSTVTWTYLVTNTGNIALTDVGVVDDQGVTVTCGASTLAVGASETCTASGTAITGWYQNIGTASGTDGLQTVSDTDPSSYFGSAPAISISKLTNGGDSVTVKAGSTVTWTYLVTNTGNIALTGVGVVDDQGVTVTCGASTLAVGASETCTASGTAIAGWYQNLGTASGTDGLQTVSASDPSSYFGAAPALSIAKTPDLQVLLVGETATFTITVTNTGNVPLVNVSVADPLSPNCDAVIASLAVGASSVYSCTLASVLASFVNVATATTVYNGDTLTVSDSATVTVSWSGRTPGYWKNHPTGWPSPYTPSATVRSVFTIPAGLLTGGKLDFVKPVGEDTLIQALDYKGGNTLAGAAQILLRAAVAALLNEQYYGNAYPGATSVASLISTVNATLATGNRASYLALATTLDYWNNGNHA